MSAAPVKLDMSTAQPISQAAVTLDMSTAQPLAGTNSPRSLLDQLANDPNNIPLDSYAHATEHGLASLGKGAAQAVNAVRHPLDTLNSMTEIGPKVMDFLSGSGEHTGQNPAQATAEMANNAYQHPLQTADWAGEQGGQIIAGLGTDAVISKAPGMISDVAKASADRAAMIAEKTQNVARNITPKQAAQGAGAIGGAVAGHNPISAYFGSKLGNVAEVLLGKERANSPIWKQAPEMTLDEMTDKLAQTIADDRARAAQPSFPRVSEGLPEVEAGQQAATAHLQRAVAPPGSNLGKELGLIKSTGARSAAETGEALADIGKEPGPPQGGQSAGTEFSTADRAAAKSLLEDSLRQYTADIVDKHIPPRGSSQAANLRTKAAVDSYLQKGDVAGAEQALDTAAKQADPSYEAFGQRQGAVPSTAEIRARAQGKFNPAERLEDQQINEQWQEHLNRHQWAAESEAKREFIARNSTGMTKGKLSAAFDTQSAAAPATGNESLLDQLQKSLEQARKKKAATGQ